jgi:hypothetical protein
VAAASTRKRPGRPARHKFVGRARGFPTRPVGHLIAAAKLCVLSAIGDRCQRAGGGALPESKALPSVVIFTEYFLSGTRQRRLLRVPHSVKLDSRQTGSLPSAGHSAQDDTRQRLVCRVSNTRQRGLSAKGRQRPS